MHSHRESDIITLSDTEEQESQDLFDSPIHENKDTGIYLVDSDDLFSSPEQSKDDRIEKCLCKQTSSLSPKPNIKCKAGTPCDNNIAQCSSSVIVSPRRCHNPSLFWRKKKGASQPSKKNMIFFNGVLAKTSPTSQKSPCISPRKSQLKKSSAQKNSSLALSPFIRRSSTRPVKSAISPEKKASSDPWTKARLNEMSRKLEERDRMMAELVHNDKDFLDIVHGGALEQAQKKAKENLVEGAVIRKKADRARMIGVSCASSKSYFDALELSPESKERRINEISRVRVVAQKMPSTPENYWEVGFPSESEQRRRGLIKEVKRKSARKLFCKEDRD